MPRMLYVEDDPEMRRSLVRLLGRELRDVCAAESVSGALALVEAPSLWCGFIVDYLIPREDGGDPEPLGIGLLEQLRARYPRAPGMLFTGLLASDVANRCAELGVSYVLKSSTPMVPRPFLKRAEQLCADLRWPDAPSLVVAIGATTREADVLRLSIEQGRTRAQIASELGISLDTVKSHVRSILSKAQSDSMRALASRVQRLGDHP